MGIPRLRLLLIAFMGAVIAVAAGDIFAERHWELLVVPATILAVFVATASRGRTVRLVGAVVGSITSTVAVAYLAGGGLADALRSVTSGPQRMLTTEWPSPSRPDLIATAALVLAVFLAAASELARRSRLHLSPLVPIVIAHGLVIALSAPLGAEMLWLLPLGSTALAFVLFRPGVSIAERWALIAGERQAVPMTALVLVLTAGLALPLGFDDRADPRRNEAAASSLSLIDPIEATLALQNIEPRVLHRITITNDAAIPARWRTAALADYDGRRWEPALTLRPIGRRLDVDEPSDIVGTIEFLDDALQLVPLPGGPVTVDTAIETDPDRTIVRLAERPTPELTVEFRSRSAPPTFDAEVGRLETRQADETVSALTQLAQGLVVETAENGVEPPEMIERLRLIEQAMRDNFELDSGARGGGLQRALIVRFLRDTRRGNAEQFVTAFVLLARSLNVDARVATGFVVDPTAIVTSEVGTTIALSSADAAVWPEVNAGGEWLAFDPVPDAEVSDAEPEPDEPQVQTPAAPQPPIAPPPESGDDPIVTDNDDTAGGENTIPTVVEVGLRVAAVIGVLLVPLLLLVGLVLGIKWRHRRRQLSGPPDAKIRGAWSVATSRLVDAGMTIPPSSTNDEIAHDGIDFAPTADRELQRLATLASAATFGSPARPDLLADDAASCLGQVETSLGASRTRWQRLRWQLSLRSLRRSTRSPV